LGFRAQAGVWGGMRAGLFGAGLDWKKTIKMLKYEYD